MMVATLGIVLALWPPVTAGADSATRYAQGSVQSCPQSSIQRAGHLAKQEPVPKPQEPAPKEKEPAPPPKPEEVKNPTVEGHVKLRNGKPAAGARIIAKGPEGALPIATADGNGMFRIAGPDGDYLLEIHASGMSRPFKAKIEGGKLSPTEFTVE